MTAPDWQMARKARHIDRFGRPRGENIIIYAAKGLIPARAAHVEGAVWERDDAGRTLVPKEFWQATLRLAGSEFRNWPGNCFRYRGAVGASGYPNPIEVIGVEFDLTEARKFLGLSGPKAEPSIAPDTLKSRGGAPRESEKWDAVVVALVRMANDGRLDRSLDSRFKTRAALRQAILDDVAVARLDVKDETIKPLIAKIFQEMLG
ncbi:hypothetical protein WG908_06270 [Sphingobium sp. AN641]|uniref:hypothetical protein n=1 Tax=Sphingobium sp. AN641 TaxID=3133443 RepID=UPI0030C1AAFE